MKKFIKNYGLYLSIILIILGIFNILYKIGFKSNSSYVGSIIFSNFNLAFDSFLPGIIFIIVGLIGIFVYKKYAKIYTLVIGIISLILGIIGLYLIGKQHLFITSAFFNTFFGISSIISIMISLIIGVFSLVMAFIIKK